MLVMLGGISCYEAVKQ